MEYDFIHSVTLIIGTPQNRLFRTGRLPEWKNAFYRIFWWHISLDFWLIVCMRKEKMSWWRWKCCGWDRIPVILSFQKALPAGANRKMEFSFQAGFWITIGDIGENNRRYFQNTRTFLVNAYFFPGKCLLLFAKMPASFRKKPGSSTSEARLSGSKAFVWLSSSLLTLKRTRTLL